MSHRILAGAFLVLLVAALPATATVHAQTAWYVDDDAPADPCPGDPNCGDPLEDGSADHPFDAIQEGIDAATDDDTVLVADGTYTGIGNKNLDYAGKAITVRSEHGAAACTIDCEGDGRGFRFHSGEGPDAIVEGLTITNGNADHGAAVYCEGSSPGLTNCTISDNTAGGSGGAVYCRSSSSPTLTNCTISGNSADYHAGGVRCFYSSPTLTNCAINGNWAQYGGGVRCDYSSPTLRYCTISGNSAEYLAGGVWCEGSSPMFANCTISGNSASSGGGVYCRSSSSPTLTNCTVSGNWAHYGGGVYCYTSSPTLTNCTISDNTAADGGGGVSCQHNSSPRLTNCRISGNWADHGGGVCCFYYSNATLTDCTISGNSAYDGGGVYCHYYGNATFANCILWINTPQEIYVDSGGPVVTYCNVHGGWPGEGNIDADPLFVDSDGPDDDPNTWEDNDFRLASESPCIDAADNTAVPADLDDLDDDGDVDEPTPFDLDGNPRFVDDPATDDTGNGTPPIVDMGAYEFQAGIVAYLDIKPGSCPNSLNLHGHGVLSAAIVGTAEFDVTQIDVDTLVLTRADGVGGGVTPLMGPPGPGIHVDDVATPFDGEPCECHEYEGDGIDDLTIKFDNDLVVTELQLTEFPGGTVVELVVSGQLLDGTEFGGTDCIRIRPLGPLPGAGPAAADQGQAESDASSGSAEADQREDVQDSFSTAFPACGLLSPAFVPVAIAGMSLARWQGRQRITASGKR